MKSVSLAVIALLMLPGAALAKSAREAPDRRVEGVSYYNDGASADVVSVMDYEFVAPNGEVYRATLSRVVNPGGNRSLPRGPIGPAPTINEACEAGLAASRKTAVR